MGRRGKIRSASEFRTSGTGIRSLLTTRLRKPVREMLPEIMTALGLEHPADYAPSQEDLKREDSESVEVENAIVAALLHARMIERHHDQAPTVAGVRRQLGELLCVPDAELIQAVSWSHAHTRAYIIRSWPIEAPLDLFDSDGPISVEHCRNAIVAARDAIESPTRGRPVSTRDEAARSFVKDVAELYERKTGRTATRQLDTNTHTPRGPFHDYMAVIYRLFPKSFYRSRFTHSHAGEQLIDYFVRMAIEEREHQEPLLPLPGSLRDTPDTVTLRLLSGPFRVDRSVYEPISFLIVDGSPAVRDALRAATPEIPVTLFVANKYLMVVDSPHGSTVPREDETLHPLAQGLSKAPDYALELPCKINSGPSR